MDEVKLRQGVTTMQSTRNIIKAKERSFLVKTPKWLLTGILLLTLTACNPNSNNDAVALPALDTLLSRLYTVGGTLAPLVFINTGGGELTSCSANSLPAGLSVAYQTSTNLSGWRQLTCPILT